MVDPALACLDEHVRNKREPDLRFAAAKDILDRAGIGEKPEAAAGGSATIQLVVMPAGSQLDAASSRPALDITALIKSDTP